METAHWHNLAIDEVLRRLDTGAAGLTSTEAARRLARDGRNEIIRRRPVSPLRLLLKQFASFFVIVLLFASALAFAGRFLPGESGRRLTAVFILGIIALSVALSFYEEYHAQKELDALDRLLVFKTTVIRDGARRQIDAAEVVPGDLLILSHGQKVPADARLIESQGLRADESALTGESLGVNKAPEPTPPDAPLAERSSMVFFSTYITQGSGTAVAVRALLWSYGAAVSLQLLALYTPLREVFGVAPLDWRAWAIMLPMVAGSSLAGVYMSRWILKLTPLWGE